MFFSHVTVSRVAPAALAAALLLNTQSALGAGGQFAVDDAYLVDPGRCQIEGWFTRPKDTANNYTLAPACNIGGNLELGLSISRYSGDQATELSLNGKTLLASNLADTYSLALAVEAHFVDAFKDFEGVDIYLPLSLNLSERLTIHSNLGGSYLQSEENAWLWGLGVCRTFHNRFGDNSVTG